MIDAFHLFLSKLLLEKKKEKILLKVAKNMNQQNSLT